MAAPHLGQSAVPTGTSTRQREQAGNRPTSFLLITDAGAQATGEGGATCPIRIEFVTRSSHDYRALVPGNGPVPEALG